MKKVYSKPEIMFEDFTLCTNIAAGCEEQDVLPSSGKQGCGIAFGPLVIFVSGVCSSTQGVTAVGTDDGEYNGICYQVPTTGVNIFGS